MMKEEDKKVDAAGLQLPEGIIQHIQSFLNGKEAAQTTLLSKSWYRAWLTRPDLHFDRNDFATESDWVISDWGRNRLSNFMKKTVERYEKLNIKIHSLWLCALDFDHSIVKELIIKALKMGATSLHLHLDWTFTLPHEVFGSEKLIGLYVKGCELGVGDGKIACSGLKSLTLDSISGERDIVWDIIWNCPLIEFFSLCNWRKFAWSPFNELNVESVVVDSPFKKLKCLLLSSVKVHPLFFNDFSSKFPCLKDLTVDDCDGYKAIHISSPSLECINFADRNFLIAKFDTPCVCKFTFSGTGTIPPSFTFKAAKRNWESSINMRHYSCVKYSWFLELNELLKKLSQSKVSLFLETYSEEAEKPGYFEDLQGLTKPKVENVTIRGSNPFHPSIFYNLFQICRPVYITHNWLHEPGFVNKKKDFNFKEFVYKRMVHQASLNSCIAYQRKYGGQCDLEEISVEIYDESDSAWCPRMYDILISPEADYEQRLRLHLRWRH